MKRRTQPRTAPIEVHGSARHPLGMSPTHFLRDCWQKRPLLIRNAFPDFTPSLMPDDLAGLACMEGALARIVLHDYATAPSSSRPGNGRDSVPGTGKMDPGLRRDDGKRKKNIASSRNDQWQVNTGPFDDDTFAQLPKSRWTLLVQDVDKWDADTAALLDAFAFIPSWRIDDVMVSYATDQGGVGAHVDQYDVFLLQGLGKRLWRIDASRCFGNSAQGRAGSCEGFAYRDDVELKLLREFDPTHEWTLDPGDMLYLPPGLPHDGAAVGECMTFSVGMRAPAASELLLDFTEHLVEALPESQRYADPDLAPATTRGEIDDAALRRARRTLGPIAQHMSDDACADWFGSFVTRYRCAQMAAPRKRTVATAKLTAQLEHITFARDPWSRFAWRRKGRDARLYAVGATLDAPVAWARELASGARVFDGVKLAKLPQRARGIAVLAALINAGHVTYRRP